MLEWFSVDEWRCTRISSGRTVNSLTGPANTMQWKGIIGVNQSSHFMILSDTARYVNLHCPLPYSDIVPSFCGMPRRFEVVSSRHVKRPNPLGKSKSRTPCFASSPVRNNRLVTSAPGLGDDLGHLVNLSLRTAEGTELFNVSKRALVFSFDGGCWEVS